MRKNALFTPIAVLAVILHTFPVLAATSATKPPKEPAKLDLKVSPNAAAPGEQVQVTLRIKPKAGIKINKYPKISMKVAEVADLVKAAEVYMGDDKAPPPEKMAGNYFSSVAPLVLKLVLDPKASAGKHEIAAKLKYYYCIKASGFCAPFRTTLPISVEVR
jgi:hypothetical protein